MLPNMSLQTSSSSSSEGKGQSSGVFDNSGFVVNYGGAVAAGGALGGVPMWLLVGAAIGGAWWLLKHKH